MMISQKSRSISMRNRIKVAFLAAIKELLNVATSLVRNR